MNKLMFISVFSIVFFLLISGTVSAGVNDTPITDGSLYLNLKLYADYLDNELYTSVGWGFNDHRIAYTEVYKSVNGGDFELKISGNTALYSNSWADSRASDVNTVYSYYVKGYSNGQVYQSETKSIQPSYPYCNDEDKDDEHLLGFNIFVKGTFEMCDSEVTLMEKWCRPSGFSVSQTIHIGCDRYGAVCFDGACVIPEPSCGDGICNPFEETCSGCPEDCAKYFTCANGQYSCGDHDGGLDYGTFGSVGGVYGNTLYTYYDGCSKTDPSVLKELYCVGDYPKYKLIDCVENGYSGCSYGECVNFGVGINETPVNESSNLVLNVQQVANSKENSVYLAIGFAYDDSRPAFFELYKSIDGGDFHLLYSNKQETVGVSYGDGEASDVNSVYSYYVKGYSNGQVHQSETKSFQPYYPECNDTDMDEEHMIGFNLFAKGTLNAYQYIPGMPNEYKEYTDSCDSKGRLIENWCGPTAGLRNWGYFVCDQYGGLCVDGACVVQGAYCGDGTCNEDETCYDCEIDCGICGGNKTPVNETSYCGDGTCNEDESCSDCKTDCGECGGVNETPSNETCNWLPPGLMKRDFPYGLQKQSKLPLGWLNKCPDPGLTPDSPFYGFEVLQEEISLALTFDKNRKIEKLNKYADERLAEMFVLLENGEAKDVYLALESYEYHLQKNREVVRAAIKEDEYLPETDKLIAESGLAHKEILGEALKKDTRVAGLMKGNIKNAIEFSDENKEEAVERLKESAPQKAAEIRLDEARIILEEVKEEIFQELFISEDDYLKDQGEIVLEEEIIEDEEKTLEEEVEELLIEYQDKIEETEIMVEDAVLSGEDTEEIEELLEEDVFQGGYDLNLVYVSVSEESKFSVLEAINTLYEKNQKISELTKENKKARQIEKQNKQEEKDKNKDSNGKSNEKAKGKDKGLTGSVVGWIISPFESLFK